MLAEESPRAYAFGPFVLHLRDRLLYRLGLPVEMHAKVFEILRCLLEHGDRLVTKELLVQEVWGGTPIGDNNITQHMHLVRQVLGDLNKPYRFIETVHGRGYRFIADIRPAGTPPPAHASAVESARAYASELVANAAFFLKMGTPAAIDSSAQLCRRALHLDPNCEDAHAGIAIAALYQAVCLFGVPSEQYAVARRHALQAMQLEPRAPRAHIAMAALALLDDLAPAVTHRHLNAAASTSSELPEIDMLRIAAFMASGDHDSAHLAAIHGTRVHAASTALHSYSAFAAYEAGDLEYAASVLERLLVFKPGAAFATYLLGLTRLVQGHYTAARDSFYALLSGRISVLGAYEKFRQRATAGLAFIEARTGASDDARALAKDVQRHRNCSYVALAVARAGAGEEDSVIACLEHARAQRDPWFPFVAADPVFREYRALPEFQAIVAPQHDL
jgi:DNA-binding winged helix-turn-helix (wHTH) protein/Flp pilus assembly protein TadD